MRFRTHKSPVNYLDDFYFCALATAMCNFQVQSFLNICKEIGFPVSMEKTYWGTQLLSFLGFLIDTVKGLVCIPADKVQRALILIDEMVMKKKTTVKQLQKLCGFLNFLCRCIVPGRVFTRRLYAKTGSNMKAHYHVNINAEMKEDLRVCKNFLQEPVVYCRPFIDYTEILSADDIDLYTDASGKIGCGGIFIDKWFQFRWEKHFLQRCKPSIEFLELFAVAIAVLAWAPLLENRRICLFVDNETVKNIINNSSSSWKNCMTLVRKIVACCLSYNLRVFAKWVKTKDNFFADALSRFQSARFKYLCRKHHKHFTQESETMPYGLWPIENYWKF